VLEGGKTEGTTYQDDIIWPKKKKNEAMKRGKFEKNVKKKRG